MIDGGSRAPVEMRRQSFIISIKLSNFVLCGFEIQMSKIAPQCEEHKKLSYMVESTHESGGDHGQASLNGTSKSYKS